MAHRPSVRAACLAVVLIAAACQDPPTASTASSRAPAASRAATPAAGTFAGMGLPRPDLPLPKLPAGARVADLDVRARAIDPSKYQCPPSTPIIDWYVAKILDVYNREPDTYNLLFNYLAADQVPTYSALYFETTARPQHFGYTGEYTQKLLRTEQQVKRFWDINSSGIQLVGMHGTVLQDTSRVAATYEFAFGVPAPIATAYAGIVRTTLLQSQTLNRGNHPIFSFNSFAIGAIPELSIPAKIVMGDGIMAGYEAVGLSDVAPIAIYAHEFGHQIQFARGYFNDPYATTGDPAEQTQYTELMADAFSAYFLTHQQGGARLPKRVEQFLQIFFQIGDCAFTNPGHHGTPNQRMKAARFGFEVASHTQGHVLTAAEFHARFVAVYPRLIAPDAG